MFYPERVNRNEVPFPGKAQDATTTWAYDDRHRLTSETVIVDDASSFVTNVISFDWDSADNRTNKTVVTTRGTENTGYVFDEDNRLLSASVLLRLFLVFQTRFSNTKIAKFTKAVSSVFATFCS